MAVNPADRPVEVVLPGVDGGPDGIKTLFGPEDGLTREGGQLCVRLPGISAGVYQV